MYRKEIYPNIRLDSSDGREADNEPGSPEFKSSRFFPSKATFMNKHLIACVRSWLKTMAFDMIICMSPYGRGLLFVQYTKVHNSTPSLQYLSISFLP